MPKGWGWDSKTWSEVLLRYKLWWWKVFDVDYINKIFWFSVLFSVKWLRITSAWSIENRTGHYILRHCSELPLLPIVYRVSSYWFSLLSMFVPSLFFPGVKKPQRAWLCLSVLPYLPPFIFIKYFSRLVGLLGPTVGKSSCQVPLMDISLTSTRSRLATSRSWKRSRGFSFFVLITLFQGGEPPVFVIVSWIWGT